jgi:hypothetical protein
MDCPRCGAELEEHEPSPAWLRHWTCPECWSAWRYGPQGLEQGRTRRELLGSDAGLNNNRPNPNVPG